MYVCFLILSEHAPICGPRHACFTSGHTSTATVIRIALFVHIAAQRDNCSVCANVTLKCVKKFGKCDLISNNFPKSRFIRRAYIYLGIIIVTIMEKRNWNWIELSFALRNRIISFHNFNLQSQTHTGALIAGHHCKAIDKFALIVKQLSDHF